MIRRKHYFNLKIPTQDSYKITVCGYNCVNGKYQLFQDSGVMEVTQSGGEHLVHTEGGQSGSPVYLNADKTEVVGIHKGYDYKIKKNLCTLVSKEMLRNI